MKKYNMRRLITIMLSHYCGDVILSILIFRDHPGGSETTPEPARTRQHAKRAKKVKPVRQCARRVLGSVWKLTARVRTPVKRPEGASARSAHSVGGQAARGP